MFHDDETGSMQRSLDPTDASAAPDVYTDALHRHIGSLEQEVARLRAALAGKEELEKSVARLREANEHLVLAAINEQALRDDAEAANRRQNEFLAMLAHELRNPLVPISMSSMLLERSANASPQLLNFTKVIRRQVDHMAALLDDLLDAARISSGKITLNLEPLSLSETIDQALETVLPRIAERSQEFTLDLPKEEIAARGDRVRLTQVFTNLIGNASKYTGDGGHISLSVRREGEEIVAVVADNGTGIAPEVLPHIFDLFTQGPRSLARSEGGLGVGLNVVRNLVSMHGGTITADSPGVGQGSRFTLRLPSCALPAAAPVLPSPASLSGGRCRVLIIEDNPDACETLKAFLDMEGHEVATARDGQAGLDALLGQDFDVVVCDIGLPGMDGLEVMSRLRASDAGARPVAIGLSGYGQLEDRARATAAGFDHYLVKPVSPDALLALVAARA
ncbi:ATP-binding protein [Massilia sp. Mn16-1_5]|uniref:hybrid sensor histidine kinase/response regulator n=1 Tax=Massilia sp. Mn16-1_5 TaxID=2079199 RepID=UPI00109EDA8F|nr:ATP-binding protein [Massilia sp. Mn16-1_5]THC41900.1 hybrid sensor histidine kinase/response regulator [Massilia sp. Mn16-1_5]